jgi:hypothetical protein
MGIVLLLVLLAAAAGVGVVGEAHGFGKAALFNWPRINEIHLTVYESLCYLDPHFVLQDVRPFHDYALLHSGDSKITLIICIIYILETKE